MFIKTTSGRNYSGMVDAEDSSFIYITDKFGMFVKIANNTIEVLEEMRE